jgi:hypothetical protein
MLAGDKPMRILYELGLLRRKTPFCTSSVFIYISFGKVLAAPIYICVHHNVREDNQKIEIARRTSLTFRVKKTDHHLEEA